MKELKSIQQRLVAPKNQTNNFGNYNYRNLEGIMEAVKPLLQELDCTITFTDDLVMLGDRIFCKSICTLKNADNEFESSTSFAELDNHKGMSKEQSTGSASSYARKYAVCSLLAIDDNADPDMLDNRETTTAQEPKKDNLTLLKDFCTSQKGKVETKTLKAFYDYWSKKIENGGFKGTMNPSSLWSKWIERENRPKAIPSNSNDMTIQEYEERTYGADDETNYY